MHAWIDEVDETTDFVDYDEGKCESDRPSWGVEERDQDEGRDIFCIIDYTMNSNSRCDIANEMTPNAVISFRIHICFLMLAIVYKPNNC
jgi:hypothetical protein